jgi:hypothetical protein
MMASSSDGRPWKQWNTSERQSFEGRRRVTSCGGTYVCKNSHCPYLHSYGKENDVQFKKRAEDEVLCNCCGYEAKGVICNAKKVWEFGQDKVTVFHCGEHNCSVKERDPDIKEAATTFFHNNTAAKPSQFPYQHLQGVLKEGKSVEEVYKEAKGMANLKKIQNIKQKVVEQENPVGHSFEALATIKESTDLKDKYLMWSVKDGRVADITAMFRSSEERLEIAKQMQRNESTHPLANEFCFLDAEHEKVKGLKTINLSVQHPLLKQMVTIVSMDWLTESTETHSEFWKQLNSVNMLKPFSCTNILRDNSAGAKLEGGMGHIFYARKIFFTPPPTLSEIKICCRASSVLAGKFWQTPPELKEASFAPATLLCDFKK